MRLLAAAVALALVLGGPGSGTAAAPAVGRGAEGAAFAPVGILGGSVRLVASDGGVLYAAEGDRVTVFDAAGGPARRRGSSASLPQPVQSLAAARGFAYAGLEGGGLVVVDARDPDRPRAGAVSYLPLDHGMVALGLALEGSYLYVAGFNLAIFDVADPLHPRFVSTADLDHIAWAVAVRNGLAYVATEETGLDVVDVTNPAAPWVRGSLRQWLGGTSIALVRDYALLGTQSGLMAVGIDDPAHPFVRELANRVGEVEFIVATGPHRAYAGASCAFFCGNAPLWLVEIVSDEDSRITEVATSPTGWSGLVVSGQALYAGAGAAGLDTYQRAADGALRRVATEPVLLPELGHAEEGARAVVATTTGLTVLDPAAPRAGSFASRDNTTAVALAGDLAYQGFEGDADRLQRGDTLRRGIRVLSVADPTRPRLVATLTLHAPPWHLAANAMLLVVGTEQGILVVDVSDPARPMEVGALRIAGDAMGVALTDHFVLVATNLGLTAVDVSDPHAPVAVSHAEITALGLVLVGGRPVVLDAAAQIHVLELGRNGLLKEMRTFDPGLPGGFGTLAPGPDGAGDELWVSGCDDFSDFTSGTHGCVSRAFSLADPQGPTFVAAVRGGTNAFWAGSELYQDHMAEGVVVLKRIEGPHIFLPVVVGSERTSGE